MGAESARSGADPVSVQEEQERVLPRYRANCQRPQPSMRWLLSIRTNRTSLTTGAEWCSWMWSISLLNLRITRKPTISLALSTSVYKIVSNALAV
ncbi:hypothetical protein [Halogeometricum pallidum]|uniref:hypothetical protein n=1 Tax=Halogeometricum pallidum TaxID=411361 RepID=UPI00373AF029